MRPEHYYPSKENHTDSSQCVKNSQELGISEEEEFSREALITALKFMCIIYPISSLETQLGFSPDVTEKHCMS